MGLLDILNGMQNGPRGQTTPAPAGSGGMSPIAMALLGLVAYKAIKQLSPGQPDAVPANRGTSTTGSPSGGGLGGLLQGPLGGLLAGGAADSVLKGGLNDLLKQFQQGGQSDVVQSWTARVRTRRFRLTFCRRCSALIRYERSALRPGCRATI